MQTATQILQALQKMGRKGLPLTRIYRMLFSEELYLVAYDKLRRNKGALTPGSAGETIDGMRIEIIRTTIDALRYECFRFRPSRRTRIPKKSKGTRPLGMPDFPEKLVQEVMRMILETYYEPRFSDTSHGFRPERGCHTALTDIKRRFRGTTWFIEGDIKGCFDNIDHNTLMSILQRQIQDTRFLNLIEQGLKAGVIEDWKYEHTPSGTPQGGVLSPLLANIYLNELDAFIEHDLIPRYTRGNQRKDNPEYTRLNYQIRLARQAGDMATVRQLMQQRRQLPSHDPQDANFRRLKYCRYADDFILGFIGTKAEAEAIKAEIGNFLRDVLHLELSQEKTLITHARTENARFLNYAVSTYQVNDRLTRRSDNAAQARSINGDIRLSIPHGLIDEHCKRYQRNGKSIHEGALIFLSDAAIIDTYQNRFRGIAEYYKYAVDRHKLGKLKNAMEQALVKTLAAKFKISVSKIYARYNQHRQVGNKTYKTLQVEVPTKNGTRVIYWGAIPLQTVKIGTGKIQDDLYAYHTWNVRTDLIKRLQADTCEMCGHQGKCEVHHIRKLSDLKQRWRGRKKKPEWVFRMIAMQRKTLVVCKACHRDIHAGRPIPEERRRND